MGQTELHAKVQFAHVFAIGTEVIAAEHAVEVGTQHFVQNLTAAGFVDPEEREEVGSEAPRPESLAVLLVASFVATNVRLRWQRCQKLCVGGLHRLGYLGDDFGQLASRDPNLQHVAKETSIVENEQWQTPF